MKNYAKGLMLLFGLLLASNLVYAQQYSVYLHKVTLQIDDEGRASVVERFHFSFPTERDRERFREVSAEFGSDIDKWISLNSKFQPNIKNPNVTGGNLTDKKLSYTEGDPTFLEISYSIIDPIMAKGKETPTGTEFNLKDTFMNNFFESGLWVIPDNTMISFELPLESEIRDKVEPEAVITQSASKRKVTWEGYKSGNELELKYVLWKQLTLNFNLSAAVNSLFSTSEGITIVILFAIILLIIFITRKKITQKIENFIAEHSELEEN